MWPVKYIDYEELIIANFKSYVGDPVVIHLDRGGLCYVRGDNQQNQRLESNGAGKTTIFDAFCWCIYGRTATGLRNPDVKPWDEKAGPTEVSLRLRNHIITRSMGPNRLLLDGKETNQERIDELVGVSFEIMSATTLLGQGRPLFFDLQPREKMDLFSDTLNLERWDERSDAANKKARALEAEVLELTSDHTAKDNTLEELEHIHRALKTQSEEWAAQWRKRTKTSRDEKAKLRRQLDEKQALLDVADLKEDGASVEAVSCQAEVEKLDVELAKLERDHDRIKDGLEIARQNKMKLQAELNRLETLKACPTCGQVLKRDSLKAHKAELEIALNKIEKALKIMVPPKLLNSIKITTERRDQNQASLIQFRDKAEAADVVIQRLRPEVAELTAQWRQLDKSEKAGKEEVNPFLLQIKETESRIEAYAKDIEELERAITDTSRSLERHKFWVKAFKDIKLQLVDEIIQELELVTNGMLDEVGLGDWEIHYALEKETKAGDIRRALNVQIASPESRGLVKWEVWSFGEGQRLRLIGALALADVLLNHAGVNPNLEILDEPTQHLSAAGVRDVVELLAYRARTTERTVFYIDHAAVESASFSSVVTVCKDKQGSYIKPCQSRGQGKVAR